MPDRHKSQIITVVAMKAPREYMPSESVPEPNAADVKEGIVSPMDIPIHTPIPLLRLNSGQFRKDNHSYRSLLKREVRKPYVCKAMRRLGKLERYRSSFRLPITSFVDKAKRLRDSMDEDFLVKQNQSSVCQCFACKHLRRWSSTLQPYRCANANCRITFASFIDLFEHQLDVHGGIDPRDNRIVNELYHQQQGRLALPPCTVYVGQQLLVPSRPPTPWKSMEELEEEARTLAKRLRDSNPSFSVHPYNMFKTAFELVKRNGWKEMKQQYHIAMEHYFSAMKYPASSRGFHDGCPSVERCRNWLTSTDREDARLLYPFSLGDKVDVEPEFVIIDNTKPVQNELRCHQGDEVVSAERKFSSEQSAKTSEDVKMPELTIDGVQSGKKQIKLENDSNGEHSSSSESSSDSDYKVAFNTANDEDDGRASESDTDSDGDSVTFPDNLLVSSGDSSDGGVVPRNSIEESDSDTGTENDSDD